MVTLELAGALMGIGFYISYHIGFRKGTATSAQATMLIMREFLADKQGYDWTDITLGKNFNRLTRWMDQLEKNGEEEKS
tara:strand:- start:34 stop:270 length:237 start_codon:yes stop_codon:yes gene_type:complete